MKREEAKKKKKRVLIFHTNNSNCTMGGHRDREREMRKFDEVENGEVQYLQGLSGQTEALPPVRFHAHAHARGSTPTAHAPTRSTHYSRHQPGSFACHRGPQCERPAQSVGNFFILTTIPSKVPLAANHFIHWSRLERIMW